MHFSDWRRRVTSQSCKNFLAFPPIYGPLLLMIPIRVEPSNDLFSSEEIDTLKSSIDALNPSPDASGCSPTDSVCLYDTFHGESRA